MKRSILSLGIIMFSITNIISAEGWTKKAGSSYFGLDFRFISSTKYHNSNGDNVEFDGIKNYSLNLYSEYGLTDELTFKLNFPFYKNLEYDYSKFSENSYFDQNNSGIGDIDLGFRYKLKKIGQTTIALGLTFGIPISTEDTYGKDKKFALSDGEFNQIIGLEAGHSLYPLPVYIAGSVKFNNRNEGYSDQFRFGIEGGYKVAKNLLLNLRLNFLKSFKNGDKEVFENQIPILANNQEYTAVKIGAFYNFYENFGVASTFDFGLSAKNILSAPVFSVGIYIK